MKRTVCFLITLFLLMSGCDRAPESPLRVAAHVWPGYEFMFLAQKQGWLDTQRLDLLETASASQSIDALIDGSVDAAALTLDEVLRTRETGVDLVVVLVFDISVGADMLLAKPGINDIAALKNKRVGVERSALGAIVLNQALQQAGLLATDIREVALTFDNHEKAWADQRVDALVTYYPVAFRLLSQGAKKLFDSRQMPNMIVDVLAVRRSVLNTHDSSINHLINMHFKALTYFNHQAQDAYYRMADHLRVLPENVVNNYRGLLLPDLDYNMHLIAGERPRILEQANLLSITMLNSSLLTKPANLSDVFDAGFLPGSMVNTDKDS